jgi:hypothetical protein
MIVGSKTSYDPTIMTILTMMNVMKKKLLLYNSLLEKTCARKYISLAGRTG